MASDCPLPIPLPSTLGNDDCITPSVWNNTIVPVATSVRDMLQPHINGASSYPECTPLYLIPTTGDATSDPLEGCQYLGSHIGNGRVQTIAPIMCVSVTAAVTPCTLLAAAEGGLTPTVSTANNAVAVAIDGGAGGECVRVMPIPPNGTDFAAIPTGTADPSTLGYPCPSNPQFYLQKNDCACPSLWVQVQDGEDCTWCKMSVSENYAGTTGTSGSQQVLTPNSWTMANAINTGITEIKGGGIELRPYGFELLCGGLYNVTLTFGAITESSRGGINTAVNPTTLGSPFLDVIISQSSGGVAITGVVAQMNRVLGDYDGFVTPPAGSIPAIIPKDSHFVLQIKGVRLPILPTGQYEVHYMNASDQNVYINAPSIFVERIYD